MITDFPLGDILHNRDATGCISKWVVELEAPNIDFAPRKAIKSQALADFVPNGQKSNNPRQMPSLTIGRYTSMDHSS
jgi:hypothetical protein